MRVGEGEYAARYRLISRFRENWMEAERER